jgi:hypothetical protein
MQKYAQFSVFSQAYVACYGCEHMLRQGEHYYTCIKRVATSCHSAKLSFAGGGGCCGRDAAALHPSKG